MVTFKDLIDRGIAKSPYQKNVNQNMFSNDPFIIAYNNIWGCISDTHMGKDDEGNYVITGQLFREEDKTTKFVYASNWGDYHFCNSSISFNTLYDFAYDRHLSIHHEIVNGDHVLVLRPFTVEQEEYLREIKDRRDKEYGDKDSKILDKGLSISFKY